jgi:hypothetical protein
MGENSNANRASSWPPPQKSIGKESAFVPTNPPSRIKLAAARLFGILFAILLLGSAARGVARAATKVIYCQR